MPTTKKLDYYELLGVNRGASADDLKRAYRKLAVQHHPDHNPDDPDAEEAFKTASEAYSVLSDPSRRRRYDQFGSGTGDKTGFDPGDLSGLGDILEGFLDDVLGRKAGGNSLPKDLKYNLEISFEEAARGVEKEIHYTRRELCQQCEGKGASPDADRPECSACRGRGQVRFQRGFFSASRPCSGCEGSGIRLDARCDGCGGKGTRERRQELNVKIPAGVQDGALRTVRGAGEQTRSGSGNLNVKIAVRNHPLFTCDGADLLCEVPVSFPQAALGAQIDVPTLEEKVSMKLPAGTQSGKVFRLRGKGLPVFGGAGKGDQLVKVLVEVPTSLTEKQRQLLQEMGEEMGTDSHPQQQSFLDKLRGLFD